MTTPESRVRKGIRVLPLFFLFFFSYLQGKELPFATKDLIFQSAEAVDQSCMRFESSIDEQLKRFVSLSRAGSYSEAYSVWGNLFFNYFSERLKLWQTVQLSPQEAIKGVVFAQGERLTRSFQDKILNDPHLFNAFLANGMAVEKLTPQERLFTQKILEEYQEQQGKKGDLTRALEGLDRSSREPFQWERGRLEPLASEALSTLRVLTANLICFPGEMTYLFGGISPWKERMDRIIEAVLKTQADLLCFQEVWDPLAARALMEKLREHYAFFVYDVGNPFGTLQVDKVGYGSGLFVASRLPLDSVHFERFPRSLPEESNRGMLLVTAPFAGGRVTFLNTHLQHGSERQMCSIRQEQLLLCYANLQAAIAKATDPISWGFLVGDLNINAFSEEFHRCGLSELFTIPYLSASSAVTAENATCTDYFTELVLTPPKQRKEVKPIYEVLDYCISPSLSRVNLSSVQKKIPLFSIDQPVHALSDHQALLTTWHVPPDSRTSQLKK